LQAATTTPGPAPDAAAPTTVGAPATTALRVPTTGAAAGTTSTRPGSVVPAPAAIRPGCSDAPGSLIADTDADGCPEALRWTDGVVEAGDRRWAVGQAGDRVAVADWSCSGRATLALLRPATGEVFVFDGWARSGHDVVAESAGRVEGGFAIRAADTGDGCPRVAVERGDGPPVTLAAAGPPPAPAPARP
ncbi:MAG: hypothetical protein LC708_04245, partial [Actinobacteria bacterium]|nr:hypothetical protein [Actinomycetota bacterium]